eukprot:TRINITY_DN7880_c0_g1_i2.p1 TRINITY_DN7880_c0_g1~~TRINITY_DN7880_c0_g1_i2.p1  ORF type:complete len:638 (-),score=111.96 TRINITY_DN7880_c0_g1_i2:1-1914(-)
MAGVTGSVKYKVGESDQIINFRFHNPYVGKSNYICKGNKDFSTDVQAKKGKIAKVTYYFVSKKSTFREYVDEDDKEENTPSFSIFTLSTALYKTSIIPEPIARATAIADSLERSSYDILCFQGIFNVRARKLLIDGLSVSYPHYISERTNNDYKGSGILIVSKFPILGYQFSLFQRTIGSDRTLGKGFLFASIDLSSVSPRKALNLFVTQLQDNPTASKIWKNVKNPLKKCKLIRAQQMEMIKRKMLESIESKADLAKHTSMIVLGDFNIKAETRIYLEKPMEEESSSVGKKCWEKGLYGEVEVNTQDVELSLVIPEFIKKINRKNIEIIFSDEIGRLLLEHKIPHNCIGNIRSGLTGHRDRLIVLIYMFSNIIYDEIIHTFENTESEDNDKELYEDIIYFFFQIVFCRGIEVIKPYYEYSSLDFWRDHIPAMLSERYGDGLTESEKNEICLQDILLKFPYQVLRCFESITGLMLRASEKEIIFTSEVPVIPLEKFEFDYSDRNTLYHVRQDMRKLRGMDQYIYKNMKGQMKPTSEYKNMMETFLGRDTFRERHPFAAGYTVLSKKNALVPVPNMENRIDYLITIDNIGSGFNHYDLQKLPCKAVDVIPMGTTPQTQLSTHFGLSATFYVRSSRNNR